MGDLVRAGKIRYFGVSNYRSWRVAEICRLCDELGIDRPVVSQPYYNAMNRMPEVEHLPGLRLLRPRRRALQPAGARRADRQVRTRARRRRTDSRAGRQDRRMMQTEWRPESLEHRAGGQAPRRGARHHRRPVRRQLGAQQPPRHRRHRRPAHRGAVGRICRRPRLPVHAGGRGADRRLVPPGHPSTPGYNDPAYPIEGRVPVSGG